MVKSLYSHQTQDGKRNSERIGLSHQFQPSPLDCTQETLQMDRDALGKGINVIAPF